jgi:hypothetical protein
MNAKDFLRLRVPLGEATRRATDFVAKFILGGCDKNAWENLDWAGKDVNARKGNRLPHEAGLKLLSVPRAPKELPASALIRNAHGIPEWKLFVRE